MKLSARNLVIGKANRSVETHTGNYFEVRDAFLCLAVSINDNEPNPLILTNLKHLVRCCVAPAPLVMNKERTKIDHAVDNIQEWWDNNIKDII